MRQSFWPASRSLQAPLIAVMSALEQRRCHPLPHGAVGRFAGSDAPKNAAQWRSVHRDGRVLAFNANNLGELNDLHSRDKKV